MISLVGRVEVIRISMVRLSFSRAITLETLLPYISTIKYTSSNRRKVIA